MSHVQRSCTTRCDAYPRGRPTMTTLRPFTADDMFRFNNVYARAHPPPA